MKEKWYNYTTFIFSMAEGKQMEIAGTAESERGARIRRITEVLPAELSFRPKGMNDGDFAALQAKYQQFKGEIAATLYNELASKKQSKGIEELYANDRKLKSALYNIFNAVAQQEPGMKDLITAVQGTYAKEAKERKNKSAASNAGEALEKSPGDTVEGSDAAGVPGESVGEISPISPEETMEAMRAADRGAEALVDDWESLTDPSEASRKATEPSFGESVQKSFDGETEQLKKRDKLAERFATVKDFDELMVLLNLPEFPGIQGSNRFYSGEELRERASEAKKTGDMQYLTRSHGFRSTVDRLVHGGQEDRTGSMREDDIVEGLGVVKAPQEPLEMAEVEGSIPDDEKAQQPESQDTLTEARRAADRGTEVLVDDQESLMDSGAELPVRGEHQEHAESIEDLRARVGKMKENADNLRDQYLRARRTGETKWYDVRKYLFPSRAKSEKPPQSIQDEITEYKRRWQEALTQYKDARIDLAKREVQGSSKGLDVAQKEAMVQALKELELRGSIENMEALSRVAWGERDKTLFQRALGRAQEWADDYRKLDWKKRVLVSASVVGIGAAGALSGSIALAGLGAGGSFALRLLGSYGAGRGVFDFLENRANKELIQSHEEMLKKAEGLENLRTLELRLQNFSEQSVSNLERMAKERKRRAWIGASAGAALFAAGSAFAYRGAIAEEVGKLKGMFAPAIPTELPLVAEVAVVSPTPLSGDPLAQGTWGEMTDQARESFIKESQVLDSSPASEVLTHRIPSQELRISPQHNSIENLLGGNAEAHREYLEFLKAFSSEHNLSADQAAKLDNLFNGGMHAGDKVITETVGGRTHIVGIERFGSGGGRYFLKEYLASKGGVVNAVQDATGGTELTRSVASPTSSPDTPTPGTVETTPEDNSTARKIAAVGVGAVGTVAAGALGRAAYRAYREGKGATAAENANGEQEGQVRAQEQEQGQEQEQKQEKDESGNPQERVKSLIESVLQSGKISEIQKKALRNIGEQYGAYGAFEPPKGIFDETLRDVADILFGADAEKSMEDENILGSQLVVVAQSGQRSEEFRQTLKNGYGILQSIFKRVGEQIPTDRLSGYRVRDVLRIFTERILTGKVPERLRSSAV